MEKYLNPYDKEYMRISMLKHEQTFKEQVYELHRLYRIQEILMGNVETNGPKNNARNHQEAHWRSDQNDFSFKHNNISQPQEKSTIMEVEEKFNEPNSSNTKHIDENEIELTLGLGPASNNKKPETSHLTSDSGRTFSSSSTGSSHIKKTSSLTKRTGGKLREGREAEEKLKQPSWLFQVLSLNMT